MLATADNEPRDDDLPKLTTSSYRLLAAFRYEMRRFLAFSEQAARNAGIEPQQHQLLLALRGLPDGARPTIGAVAERLCVQHHTAVALVDKLERRALLVRERGADDKRQVLLRVTAEGETLLQRLSALHRQQLLVAGPAMVGALKALVGSGRRPTKAMPSAPRGHAERKSRKRAHTKAERPTSESEVTSWSPSRKR
jgi:DNA-binding MarR family transcriptional regulator